MYQYPKEATMMAGHAGGRRSRLDVLIGTSVVMAVLMLLVAFGQGHMGHTHTINFNLQAPHLTAPQAPSWAR
jgi:hypothetical protein